MKHLLLFLAVAACYLGYSQSIVFQDDFESGTSNWNLTNNWGLNSSQSHSGSYSLTESPSGNYTDNETSYATMSSGVNLSQSLSANLSFWAKYNIEGGFDYMYLEVSPNGGSSWIQLDSYDDTLNDWSQFTYSLGGYVGNSNVKIRFKFESDGAVNFDGMLIDDFVITSDTVDNAPPLILHNEPEFYEASLISYTATADIIDISGIYDAKCFFRFDGGNYDSISPSNVTANSYEFVIPQQLPGTYIDYYFKAIDSSQNNNSISSEVYQVIQGNYISYDNGVVDFVDSTGTGGGRAVKVTLPGPSQPTTLLIRNYTDVNRPNDSMLVHLWADNGGQPGADLITPVMIYPSATLQHTSPMTVIDLRSDSANLAGVSGDIFVGFTVPSGGVWITMTQPGITTRSFSYNGASWTASSGTSGASDYHFRLITSGLVGLPSADFSIDTSQSPQVSFTNLSNDESSYSWDFGDYTSLDTNENPSHTYPYNGIFKVCLTVGNNVGDDSTCKYVNINSYPIPVSMFTYSDSLEPEILFFDQSTNNPTSWHWDFDHNGAQSGMQNPSYQYPQIYNSTYNICLTASSINGSGNAYCEQIIVLQNGIDEIMKNELVIKPNPFTDNTFIQMEVNELEKIIFNVYDLSGKLINVDYEVIQQGIKLTNNNLQSGHYIYEIIYKDQKYSGSIIVK